MVRQITTQEEFASVQEAQAGITKLFLRAKNKMKFIRIMRNQEPLGVLIPNDLWMSLIEDLEALSSTKYIESIQKSRSGKKRYPSKEVKKILRYEGN